MSFTFGKFKIFIDLFDKIDAANIGNEAFLDPDTLIIPLSFLFPETSSVFILFILLVKLPQFDPYIYLFCLSMTLQDFHYPLKKQIELLPHLHIF